MSSTIYNEMCAEYALARAAAEREQGVPPPHPWEPGYRPDLRGIWEEEGE